jgi:micrococcal nuclease
MVRARLLVLLLAFLVVTAGCVSPTTPEQSTQMGTSTATTETTPAQSTSSVGTPMASTRPVVTATVVDVVDGDTIKVRFENGTRETVRLLGVDTPEVYSENTPDEFEGVPETDAGRQCLRRYGDRASEFATDTLAGETVRLGFDENEGRRGYYGRLLAYVYLDGDQFNYRLVAEGYARMYDSNFVERERYAVAERAAQEANRGVWSCATAVADGGTDSTAGSSGDSDTGDVADAPLEITVHADATGPDGDNLNDEYVVLRNTGSSTLDLGGWTVADAADHVYSVPAGTTVAPGDSLTIHTGDGSDTATDVYWGRASPVWNNDGDTVTVRDDRDDTVAVMTYD